MLLTKLSFLLSVLSICVVCYTMLCKEPCLSSVSENKALGSLHDDRICLTLLEGPGRLTRVGLS